ncbi:proline dehydrogenase [Mycetohabitans endofungorum]|uniref:carbamoyltransferase C-terminal domain-containing protein n=1 Tax=Mycetohabitans endofungorum TaxID=417203 RepID=UPI0030D45FAB
MLILSFKPGHDGAVAAIEDGNLLFSFEAEKDSFFRYAPVTPELTVTVARHLDRIPDVIAMGGWYKGVYDTTDYSDNGVWTTSAGYFGESSVVSRRDRFMGKEVEFFSSSHARSHIWNAFGMSGLTQGQPAYCLVWEGGLGDFYEIDENNTVTHIGTALTYPGIRYQLIYALADPTFSFTDLQQVGRIGDAGKLMAIAAYSDCAPPSEKEAHYIEHMLSGVGYGHLLNKASMNWSGLIDVGVESIVFKNFARKFSDALFERFHQFARKNLTKRLPLLIAGGCGLNCDWNTMWENTGLFESVFIPPCANDSGSAIGTAIDAQRHYTGQTTINWSVYAGEDFFEDVTDTPEGFIGRPLDVEQVAADLAAGKVIAWARGKCEIGPRALGNRSLLAAPFSESMTARLNQIKQREGFRPIAPICLEEEAERLFGRSSPSPYMLHFTKVRSTKLRAVTHVDGSARVQTVNRGQNPAIYELLCRFRELTGYGVLCNTSLNFNGRGFINRTSDLVKYVNMTDVDGFVTSNRYYKKI